MRICSRFPAHPPPRGTRCKICGALAVDIPDSPESAIQRVLAAAHAAARHIGSAETAAAAAGAAVERAAAAVQKAASGASAIEARQHETAAREAAELAVSHVAEARGAQAAAEAAVVAVAGADAAAARDAAVATAEDAAANAADAAKAAKEAQQAAELAADRAERSPPTIIRRVWSAVSRRPLVSAASAFIAVLAIGTLVWTQLPEGPTGRVDVPDADPVLASAKAIIEGSTLAAAVIAEGKKDAKAGRCDIAVLLFRHAKDLKNAEGARWLASVHDPALATTEDFVNCKEHPPPINARFAFNYYKDAIDLGDPIAKSLFLQMMGVNGPIRKAAEQGDPDAQQLIEDYERLPKKYKVTL